MNKKILMIPALVLLTACGSKDNKEKIYNKTFTYSGNYYINESEYIKWLNDNFNDIDFDSSDENHAHMEVLTKKSGQEPTMEKIDFDKEGFSSVDELQEEMNEMISNEIDKSFPYLTIELGANNTGRIIVAKTSEKEENDSAIVEISFTDTPNTNKGTSIDFLGTVVNPENEVKIRGAFSIGGWDKEGKIQYTNFYMEKNDKGKWSNFRTNYAKFYFPLKEATPSNPGYSVEARLNYLPKVA